MPFQHLSSLQKKNEIALRDQREEAPFLHLKQVKKNGEDKEVDEGRRQMGTRQ
jgi:hypothetical protein